jgi:hypothetical protein
LGNGVSLATVPFHGEAWASQVSGPSSYRAPKSNTPPDSVTPRPISTERRIWSSRPADPSTSGTIAFSAPFIPGSRFRPPTYRTPRYRYMPLIAFARLATGPGGLALDRTGFAPAGRLRHVSESTPPSIPVTRPCLVTPPDAYPSSALSVSSGDRQLHFVAMASRMALPPKKNGCVLPRRGICYIPGII